MVVGWPSFSISMYGSTILPTVASTVGAVVGSNRGCWLHGELMASLVVLWGGGVERRHGCFQAGKAVFPMLLASSPPSVPARWSCPCRWLMDSSNHTGTSNVSRVTVPEAHHLSRSHVETVL
jgi:hypothetical protein